MYSNQVWAWIAAIVISYLLGCFSPAIVLSRYLYKDDIRKYGSGNAGMTNMLRTYGKGKAAITFALDALKTVLAVLIGRYLLGGVGFSVSAAAVCIGHAFPVYYGFRGGKAAVCSATSMALMDWRIFLVEAVVFFLALFWKKTVSISTLSSAVIFPFVTYLFYREMLDTALGISYMIFSVFLSVFVIWLHRGNIKRLASGTELGFDKKGKVKK